MNRSGRLQETSGLIRYDRSSPVVLPEPRCLLKF